MNRDEKAKQIEALKKDFERAKNILLTNFKGLTVAQDTELRQKMHASKAKYKVVKNTLAKIAARGTPVEALADQFDGNTSLAIHETDPVALAKMLVAYAKANPAFSFKAGIVEGRVVSLADVQAIAELPSREELLGKLLFVLKAPLTQLASVLQASARNLAVVLGQIKKSES